MLRGVASAVLASTLMGSPAHAVDPSAALAVVQRFAAAPDRATYASFCAPDMIYVDHVPPYVFSGPSACEDEWDAAERWAQQNRLEVTDWGRITAPSFVDVHDDSVYAVYPVRATLTRNGRREVEEGFWTFVVQRRASGWLIRAATFSTVQFVPDGEPR
ncbi:nuclear transport factor 2 family protein [Phenylobacterium sp.]|uniref:nuclear transport factor 2 family protein n=1 Tax=Phenylobacterium sp. TaxID=1871053 RepID=UPI0025F39EFE|nr:nuclear transport factor 2 family protein [Phenylobacterium sp.]